MRYKHGKHVLELYDSIDTMKIGRFQKFNKLQIQASDVGSDFQDFQQHIARISQYVQKDLKEHAIKELENFNISLFNAFNEISPGTLSFACLIRKIDDQEYNEHTDSALQKCLEHLEEIKFSKKDAQELLREVKKKYKLN